MAKIDTNDALDILAAGETAVSLYRVHFKWKEKEIELMAKSLDLTHPYFVSIKNLVFSTEQKLVINPLEEETRKDLREVGSPHDPVPDRVPHRGAAGERRRKVMPFASTSAKESP